MTASSVHLIIGDDEFLTERARLAIQASHPGAEVTQLSASDITPADLLEATSPSLFHDNRVVVIPVAATAGADLVKTVLAECVNPAPGMTLVVIYKVAEKTLKGKKKPPEIVAKLSKIAQVHEVFALPTRELKPWVMREFQSHGVRPTPDIVEELLRGVGSHLRALASAVAQLVFDTQGEVTLAAVREYYSGVAEVANWDIADAAVAGRTADAVATCRRALQLGASPVAIAYALAAKVAAIARLYDARGDHFSLAKDLGMNPYAVKATMPVARRWNGANVTRAVLVIDQLSAAVVGQGDQPEYAVEAAVRQISELAH